MIHGISEGGKIEEKLEASFRIFDADGSGKQIQSNTL
jgi:Ca2+-binding EF-hand superfamily protein